MLKKILISESASKKQLEVAKLLWGAKGKTLVANFEVLNKLKKKLGEDEQQLLNTIAQFLKASLDDKTVTRLKKRKGFDSLPTRMKNVVAKLKKLQPLRDKHDVAMKGLKAFSTLLGKEAGKMTSQSATKNQQETAKVVWGAKGKVVVAQYDILNKVKKKLGQDEQTLIENLGLFLKASFDQRTIDRLKKRKGFDTLGTRLKALASNAPKLFAAQDAYKKDMKEVLKFNAVLGKAIETGAAGNVAKTSNTAAQKAADKVLKGRKGNTPKAPKGSTAISFTRSAFNEALQTLADNVIDATMLKNSALYVEDADLADTLAAFDEDGIEYTVHGSKPVKKKGPALSQKQMNANRELAQGMTIARGIGFENGEHILEAMKKAGMKNVDSYPTARDTVQFDAKGTLESIATKFLKHLKKNPDTNSSLMHIKSGLDRTKQIYISTYVNGTRAIVLRNIAGQMTIGVENKVTVSNLAFDGAKYFITPAAANDVNKVLMGLRAGGRAPSKVKEDKADIKNLTQFKEYLSLGLTAANVRKNVAKLSKSTQQDLLNEVPELGEI